MKKKIQWTLPLLLLAFVFPQWSGAQEKDTVKFQAQSGELQGQIRIVEPESGLLIVESNSISYSFKITPATKVLVGNQKAKIEDLAARKGQTVTVKFRAERKGNMANEITAP